MSPRNRSGQASTEYVAVITLVAIVLTLAATAVAAPGIPGAVVRTMKVGLCLVGGDVCRPADAVARHLEPCVTSSAGRSRDNGVSIAVIRVGHGRDFVIEQRSDGSVVVRGSDGGSLALVGGPGIRLGPVVIGPEGSAGVAFRTGREWRFPDAAAAKRFLDLIPDEMQLTDDGNVHYWGGEAAQVRYLKGGAELGVKLAAEVGGARGAVVLPGVEGEARAAIGRREAPEGDTLFFELGARSGGALAEAVPALARSGTWIAEWQEGEPDVVTLRSSGKAAGTGRRTERSIRLSLEDPGDRAAALKFVVSRVAGPLAGLAARDFLRRVAERGAIERLTYAEERDDRGLDLTGRAGPLALGFDHTGVSLKRRLVAAEVISGGATAQRRDCLGLDERS